MRSFNSCRHVCWWPFAAPLGVALFLLHAPVPALTLDPGAEHVQADLLGQSDAAAPGTSIWVGVRLRHEPHWHTYWTVPGDAGLPTQLRWNLPDGYRAGSIEWPVPRLLRVGNLANYGYEGEVLLPVAVRVPETARIGSTARLAVHADWLVCNDLCIPGGADLALALPVRAPADIHPGAGSAALAQALTRVPAPLVLAGATARLQGEQVRLEFPAQPGAHGNPHTLDFFPLEGGRIVAAADQRLNVSVRRVRLDLAAASPVEAGFARLRGVLVADGGPGEGPGGWAGVIDLPLARGAVAPASAADAATGMPRTTAQAVPDPAPQMPGAATGAISATVPADPPAPVPVPATVPANAPPPISVALALAGAFLGGMILNLMPCVFPVLSLKLFALVRHREETAARLRAHGFAYAAGVVFSFLVLAGLMVGLRAAGSRVGWGFQLQSPPVIAALIGLFYLIGLNLLGAFEFTFGAGLANTRAAQSFEGEGLRGSFGTGVLAAVVASPCTAPFMGAALGYAVTQSAPVALLVFGALGAGMAAPYVLLTMVPALLDRLPRPGAWMEHLRQVMAFPMFLTCVWLFWILGQQTDMDAVAWMLVALVGLGLFAWSTGLAQRGTRGYRWLALAAAVVSVLLLARAATSAEVPGDLAAGSAAGSADYAAAPAPRAGALPASHAAPGWGAWSPAAQRSAIARGQPVFVDFTAAWCITCQANKRLVLRDARVEEAFLAHGVVRLEADWTRRDAAITRELEQFARGGVPMYVLYDRRGGAHLLPEILSTQGVLDALAGA